MRADGVVDLFPVREFTIEFFHLQRTRRDLVELLGVIGAVAFDGAVEFGECPRSTNRCKPFRWQAGSKSAANRSEEHTSELQSLRHLVCRLLLEKKKSAG